MNPLSDGRGACTACHSGRRRGWHRPAPNLSTSTTRTHECFAGCNWETFRRGTPLKEAWLRDSDPAP